MLNYVIEKKKNQKHMIFVSFVSKSYFSDNGSQNVFIIHPIFITFTIPDGITDTITAQKSKGLLNEKVKAQATANNSLSPKLKQHSSKRKTEFKGSCLKQDKITFTLRNIMNLFIAYE